MSFTGIPHKVQKSDFSLTRRGEKKSRTKFIVGPGEGAFLWGALSYVSPFYSRLKLGGASREAGWLNLIK
jgi:hypothetical protein